MGLSCGIVGLPNVGKSTLFNALLAEQQASAENYPFCTIEPNRGRIAVPSPVFDALVACVRPERAVPNFLEIVDIAGLVRGAAKGEGLGNKFLAHIREVDAVLHLVRCFSSERVLHVERVLDPVRDIAILETELLLADINKLAPLRLRAEKATRTQPSRAERRQHAVVERLLALLDAEQPARALPIHEEEERVFIKNLGLLSAKPMLYVCNVEEAALAQGNAMSRQVQESRRMQEHGQEHGQEAACLVLCAQMEAELIAFAEPERRSLLESIGETKSGLERCAAALYSMLDVIPFFTAGKQEVRAWTIRRGQTAFDAAGKIHSDFQRGFICAETLDHRSFLEYKSFEKAREHGKVRQEGKNYRLAANDVLLFRFNV